MDKENICIFFIIVSVLSEPLPPYLMDKRCSLKKDFNTCFRENGNLAIPLVARGDPDYNIQRMNPIEVSFIQFISEPNLNLNLTDVTINGLAETRIVETDFNGDQKLIALTLNCAKLIVAGTYVVNGRILSIPLKKEGQFSVLLKNGVYNLTCGFEITRTNSDDYFKVIKMTFDFNFDNVVFEFYNLFGGNKELGNQVTALLNNNWRDFVADLAPEVSTKISSIIREEIENFSTRFPLKNIFIDYI